MNLKTVRIIACVVIVICVFFTGIGLGVIIESAGIISQKAGELENYARSSDFMLAIGGEKTSDSESVKALFEPFWESWDLLHMYFVDQPLDDNAMMEGAIRGMMASRIRP